MARVKGTTGVAKVEVSLTPTAFTYELSSSINISPDPLEAVDKSVTGWKSIVPGLKEATISARMYIDDTSNPALAVVTAAVIADTLLVDNEFSTGVTGHDFTMDGYVFNYGINADSQGYCEVSFDIRNSGAVVAA